MKFPKRYKIINTESYTDNVYSLIPIRYEDRNEIMKWRNDQIDILRQKETLTQEQQDKYFKEVVSKLFEEDKPNQILFSFLKDNVLIGYGGLVHIDWDNKNAEISFLLKNEINNRDNYLILFEIFLKLISKTAKSANLHKIYTIGYDILDYRFFPLIKLGYNLDANLKDHIKINHKFFDIKIYSILL